MILLPRVQGFSLSAESTAAHIMAMEYANRGRVTGLWIASFFLGQFLCPFTPMAMESATGLRTTAVSSLGFASAVVAIGLLPLLRRTPTSQEAARA